MAFFGFGKKEKEEADRKRRDAQSDDSPGAESRLRRQQPQIKKAS